MEPIKAYTLQATPKTDAKLRKKYFRLGNAAKLKGLPRVPPGDPTSMIAGWWFEGYDS